VREARAQLNGDLAAIAAPIARAASPTRLERCQNILRPCRWRSSSKWRIDRAAAVVKAQRRKGTRNSGAANCRQHPGRPTRRQSRIARREGHRSGREAIRWVGAPADDRISRRQPPAVSAQQVYGLARQAWQEPSWLPHPEEEADADHRNGNLRNLSPATRAEPGSKMPTTPPITIAVDQGDIGFRVADLIVRIERRIARQRIRASSWRTARPRM